MGKVKKIFFPDYCWGYQMLLIIYSQIIYEKQ